MGLYNRDTGRTLVFKDTESTNGWDGKTILGSAILTASYSIAIINESDHEIKPSRPCFNVTKKGCEFIAHKLTGIKETIFTAKYINRFHDMEKHIKEESRSSIERGLYFVKFIADDLSVSESSRLFIYENYCKDGGVPIEFLPKYTDNGSRERIFPLF